ncbi:MAG: hypothetical protein IKM18_09290 [Clostridia bacterium]|nr:hypothetical protein [Clostridia bacterium]
MKGNDFLEKISLIDPAYIEAADTLPKVKKIGRIKRYCIIAACIVLIFAAGFGTYVAASEIKEYKDAVEFFEDYDLSTEGLTRGEIKKVYRDITTKSFTYSKTAEVILNSISNDKVSGFEIPQEDPTPEDLEIIWDIKKHNSSISAPQDPTSQNPTPPKKVKIYASRYDYKAHIGYFELYDGTSFVWSTPVSEFKILGHVVVSDGIIVYGGTELILSEQPEYPWIAKFDENGNVLWKQQINDEFHTEFITHVLENADGSYTVISRGDFNYFCFSRYTSDGKKILYKKTNIDIYGIKKVARFGNGYIVHLFSNRDNEHAKIVMVDHEGNITESFSYSSEDSKYYITDMIEFENKIYLSAYAIPKYGDKEHQHELKYFSAYLDYNNYGEITSDEERTLAFREFYTAILLVCDPKSGKPQEFYSVKGSLGGKLALSDSGELLWDVERITSTFYSPYTSSYTIGGTCHVFRYTFNSSGLIVNQEKTGEITAFRK